MAWQPTLNDVAYTLVVKKRTGGVPEVGYPKTYNLLNAFGSHQAITQTEWAQFGDSLRLQRLNDFRTYVSETEGTDITPTITNNDHRQGARLLPPSSGWARTDDGLIIPFDETNTPLSAFYDSNSALEINGFTMPWGALIEIAFDGSYINEGQPDLNGFLRGCTSLRFANITPLFTDRFPPGLLRKATTLERICFRTMNDTPVIRFSEWICQSCPGLKIIDIGRADWTNTIVPDPTTNFTADDAGNPITPGTILGPSSEAITTFKAKFPTVVNWAEGLVDYASLT